MFSVNRYFSLDNPDLSAADFFFWGCLKTEVFLQLVRMIEELEARIITCVAQITPAILKKVFWNLVCCVVTCKNVDGTQLQHLL